MPTPSSEQRILEQLRLGREEMPDWREVLDLQIALLEGQMEADVPAAAGVLDAEEATRRRRAGIPLVTGRELALDWKTFAALYGRVCQIGAAHRTDLADEFARLREAAGDRELLASWVIQFMTETRSASDDDTGGLRAFVLTHTLRPFLRRYAEASSSLVDQRGWRRGYCPICGGEPDLASLGGPHDEGEGTRFLLCSRCDFEWHYPRVGCPFCENKDHTKISYYPEAKGPHRLYVCQACNRYLKTIDLRAGPGRVLLPVERILTIGMDVMARESGYS
jgi:FdhE protein